MSKITIDELMKIKEQALKLKAEKKAVLMLCAGSSCSKRDGLKIKAIVEEELKARGILDTVLVGINGCSGLCEHGPILQIYPEGYFYEKVKPDYIPEIIEEHVIKGNIVEKYMYNDPTTKKPIPKIEDIPTYKLQSKRVLQNRTKIDPTSIDDYIAQDGYRGAIEAITNKSPMDVIGIIKDAALRGRGGSGFPTGTKWEIAAYSVPPANLNGSKYVICNAGAISRAIMEIDPHSIIEGMIIAGYAIGAHTGYIYIREPEHKSLIQLMEKALKGATKYGLLGKNILNTTFSFNIELFIGAGTFICGEETALIASIEGKRGYPTPKPPYPATRGLWNCPTVVDNGETFANVPQIILKGAQWFKTLGTDDSSGTKLFTLTGPLQFNGLVEVPFGVSLKSMVYDISGGLRKGSKLKAVQIGGPTGAFLPPSSIEMPLTYGDIKQHESIVGSSGIIVLDQNTCIVNAVRLAMTFGVAESCGKCVPCRIGTTLMLGKLTDITEGKATENDMQILEDIAIEVKRTSLCGFGRTIVLPLLSAMKHFKEEFYAHIHDKWCKAGVCKTLSTFTIDGQSCKGCTSCARKCPVSAISGERKKPHSINQSLCIRCRTCYETCTFNAIKIGHAAWYDPSLASAQTSKEENQ
ncbi:MAG: 4Fe-4S binding protein [Candidatus Magnetoovum sp. WYHC-5]|nr:4Fe-4S binding protein [Candidatus Magnetoovum sp. WYHC-5]